MFAVSRLTTVGRDEAKSCRDQSSGLRRNKSNLSVMLECPRVRMPRVRMKHRAPCETRSEQKNNGREKSRLTFQRHSVRKESCNLTSPYSSCKAKGELFTTISHPPTLCSRVACYTVLDNEANMTKSWAAWVWLQMGSELSKLTLQSRTTLLKYHKDVDRRWYQTERAESSTSGFSNKPASITITSKHQYSKLFFSTVGYTISAPPKMELRFRNVLANLSDEQTITTESHEFYRYLLNWESITKVLPWPFRGYVDAETFISLMHGNSLR